MWRPGWYCKTIDVVLARKIVNQILEFFFLKKSSEFEFSSGSNERCRIVTVNCLRSTASSGETLEGIEAIFFVRFSTGSKCIAFVVKQMNIAAYDFCSFCEESLV